MKPLVKMAVDSVDGRRRPVEKLSGQRPPVVKAQPGRRWPVENISGRRRPVKKLEKLSLVDDY